MAAGGYGPMRPTVQESGIVATLMAYAQQGGALYASYRQVDNPLTLTNVRWVGDRGEVIEAQRNPSGELEMSREEREAWTQVALVSMNGQPDAVGPNAPWLQAPLDRRVAFDLAVRAQQAFNLRQSPYSGANSAPRASVSPYTAHPSTQVRSGSPPRQSGDGYDDEYAPTRLLGNQGGAPPPGHAPHHIAPSQPDMPQATGSWQREDLFGAPGIGQQSRAEVIVIPCVEMEMPAVLTTNQQDFTRDFARDVATHFSRAARSLPQSRELRGWMRGGRIVLGVAMVVGTGSRPATRGEMEMAASSLAEALARRTLPYVQMRFTDANEWNQGLPLPE